MAMDSPGLGIMDRPAPSSGGEGRQKDAGGVGEFAEHVGPLQKRAAIFEPLRPGVCDLTNREGPDRWGLSPWRFMT